MIKILVIGCGSIGIRHIRSLQANAVKNIAAYRTNQGTIKELPSDIRDCLKIFTDFNEVEAWAPTHIIVSNPTSLHPIFLKKAIISKCRVLVEKPIADTTTNLLRYVQVEELLAAKGCVGYNLRFHGVFNKLKDIIDSNIYGKTLSASLNVGHYLPFWHPYEDYREGYAAQKRLGGGVLRTLSHEVDLVQYLFGKIKSVNAVVGKISDLEIDCDDNVDIMCNTQICSIVKIHLDYLNPVVERYGRILFDQGLLIYDFIKGSIFWTDYQTRKQNEIYHTDEDYNEQYIKQISDFCNGVTSICCDLRDGLHILNVIEACEQSSTEEKTICLD